MDRVISKLLEVDPTFAAFMDRINGVSKSMPGVSDVSTPGQNKGKKAIAGGLLFGTAAEGTGSLRAVQAAKQAVKPGYQATHAVLKAPASPKVKVAEAGLQVANLGVGLAAARELLKKPKTTTPVSKGYLRAQPMTLIHSRARLARTVANTPKTPVAKARFMGGLRDAAELSHGLNSAAHARNVERMRASGAVDEAKAAFAGRGTKGFARHSATPDGPRHASTSGRGPGKLVAVGAAGAAAGSGGALSVKRRQPVTKGLIELTWKGEISKVDPDKRQVFGWASLAVVDGQPVVDLQDDVVTIDEIEKSAYRYVLESRIGGDMHSRVSKAADAPLHTSDMIESFVVTPEKLEAMGLAPDALPLGWWIGQQVNDEAQWQLVKQGKRLGFSVHGSGVRKELVAA